MWWKTILGQTINMYKTKNTYCVKKPIVVITGATGTGKTKLSVEIASKYNGEIVNADAMQLYNGLNIITNKATEKEQKGIPHHLIGVVDPSYTWTVIEYRENALKIINNLHKQNKLPIVVGGTNYYLEAILFELMSGYWEEEYSPIKVGQPIGWCAKLDWVDSSETDVKQKVNEVLNNLESSSNDLYKVLEEVDPNMAMKYHNNEKRKLRRALEIWVKTGLRLSDIIEKQQEEVNGLALGGIKRFENVLILWMQCEKEALMMRLRERVQEMLYRGLLDEVEIFHNQYNKKLFKEDMKLDKRGLPLYYQQGVFQCIGFKEFHEYLVLEQVIRDSKKGRQCYLRSVDLMQQRTIKYVKKQEKWIRNRLLIRDRMNYPLYGLNTSDPSKWEDNVTAKVDVMMNAFTQGNKIPFEPEVVEESEKSTDLVKGDRTRYICEVCEIVLMGKRQHDDHFNGARHQRGVNRKQNKAGKVVKNPEEQSS